MLVSAGCEEEAGPMAAPAVTAASPATAPARPQGQDLLAAPRKPLLLDVLPFTLEVPEGWQIVRRGDRPATSLSLLEGQLPSGDQVRIILSMRDSISADRLQDLLKRIEKERPTIEQKGGKLVARDTGSAHIIERRERLSPSRLGRLPATAPTHLTTSPATSPSEGSVDWRIQLFVRSGPKFSQYELNFMDLNAEKFAKDEALLEEILATLKYVDAPPLF